MSSFTDVSVLDWRAQGSTYRYYSWWPKIAARVNSFQCFYCQSNNVTQTLMSTICLCLSRPCSPGLCTTRSSSVVWVMLRGRSTKKFPEGSGLAPGGAVLGWRCRSGLVVQFWAGLAVQFWAGDAAACRGNISLSRSFYCHFPAVSSFKCTDKKVMLHLIKSVVKRMQMMWIKMLFALGCPSMKHFCFTPEICFSFVSPHSIAKITMII